MEKISTKKIMELKINLAYILKDYNNGTIKNVNKNMDMINLNELISILISIENEVERSE